MATRKIGHEVITQAQLTELGMHIVEVEDELGHPPQCSCPAKLHRRMTDDQLYRHMLEFHGVYLRNLDPEWRAHFYGDETWNGAYH